jgi:hypothetical protein
MFTAIWATFCADAKEQGLKRTRQMANRGHGQTLKQNSLSITQTSSQRRLSEVRGNDRKVIQMLYVRKTIHITHCHSNRKIKEKQAWQNCLGA